MVILTSKMFMWFSLVNFMWNLHTYIYIFVLYIYIYYILYTIYYILYIYLFTSKHAASAEFGSRFFWIKVKDLDPSHQFFLLLGDDYEEMHTFYNLYIYI